MNISRRSFRAALVVALAGLTGGVTAVVAGAAPSAPAAIPFGQRVDGKATFYNDTGLGACGTSIDAAHQMLVAVSHEYWTSANPNDDPLCSGVSVEVSFGGKSITVPVVDKCPSCDRTHIDLSQPAFAELGNPDLGVLNGVTWTFVKSGSGAGDDVPAGDGTPAESTEPSEGEPSSPSGQPTGTSTADPASPRGSATRGTGTAAVGKAHRRHGRGSVSASGSGASTREAAGAAAAGTTLEVLLTGYGWWDNTPPGSSEISHPVIHQTAGGTGTYDDPITVAVPYHCQDGDGAGCLQWPAGTRFYLPSLKRYLIVEDVCGDGGPDTCPDSTGNHLDVWVGGRTLTHAESDACEERITGTTKAILKPAAGLAVTPGDICR